MPSTTSSSVSSDFASSTVMTPSLPTFCMASAIMSPTVLSPFAEIVPTCATSAEVLIFFDCLSRSLTTAMTAMSMPRFRSIGFMPAATYLAPSFTIEWARTVAVVVPSPAMSLVFEATSRTICAPMFSNLSSSSISLATVTPSLVMRGAPNDLSRTTLRPLGPSVTLTALARMSTPRSMRSRASTENFTSLAAIVYCSVDFSGRGKASGGLLLGDGLFENAHDVGLLHDQEILAVDRDQLAGLVAASRADGDHFALRGLFLGGVGNDDAAGGLLLGIDALDDDAVVKRAELHGYPPKLLDSRVFLKKRQADGSPVRPLAVELVHGLLTRKGAGRIF